MLGAAIQPASILGPIVGVLLVSSEWSQRTAQITFTLVPKRTRVIAAKLLASLVVALIAYAVSILVAVLASAIAGGDMSVSAGMLGQLTVLAGISMVGGVAFGALLLASAPAIVTYFLAPIAFAALMAIPWFDGVKEWVDGSQSYSPMTEHVLSGTEWAHVGTTTLLWLALPLALGIWRIVRNEVP